MEMPSVQEHIVQNVIGDVFTKQRFAESIYGPRLADQVAGPQLVVGSFPPAHLSVSYNHSDNGVAALRKF